MLKTSKYTAKGGTPTKRQYMINFHQQPLNDYNTHIKLQVGTAKEVNSDFIDKFVNNLTTLFTPLVACITFVNAAIFNTAVSSAELSAAPSGKIRVPLKKSPFYFL